MSVNIERLKEIAKPRNKEHFEKWKKGYLGRHPEDEGKMGEYEEDTFGQFVNEVEGRVS